MAYTKTTTIRVTHNDLGGDPPPADAQKPREALLSAARWFERMASGIDAASVEIAAAGAVSTRATGTATFLNVVATNAVTINGVAITAVAGAPAANQFQVGGTDTISAANCAAAINASVTALVKGYVTATSNGTVVTISAMAPGLAGNMFTLAKVGVPVTVSGANLAGGTGDNIAAVTCSRS